VQIGGATTRVRAVEALGEERKRLWAELIRREPAYEEYQRRTDRRIPVVFCSLSSSTHKEVRNG
jgi:hypothetical protein